MRVPVAGYSLSIGKAHTDFAEAKLQQRLVARKLSDQEINQLAVVAMAGATAEAMNYDDVSSSCIAKACTAQMTANVCWYIAYVLAFDLHMAYFTICIAEIAIVQGTAMEMLIRYCDAGARANCRSV